MKCHENMPAWGIAITRKLIEDLKQQIVALKAELAKYQAESLQSGPPRE